MERNELISKLIKDSGYSIKAFAEKCGIPYTTLHSILKKDIGNASIDNMILICKNLGITVEQLENTKTFDTIKPNDLIYVIGENGEREVRYTNTSDDALLEEMGIRKTNYIISKENIKTELSDNEYDFLINSLDFFRKK